MQTFLPFRNSRTFYSNAQEYENGLIQPTLNLDKKNTGGYKKSEIPYFQVFRIFERVLESARRALKDVWYTFFEKNKNNSTYFFLPNWWKLVFCQYVAPSILKIKAVGLRVWSGKSNITEKTFFLIFEKSNLQ